MLREVGMADWNRDKREGCWELLGVFVLCVLAAAWFAWGMPGCESRAQAAEVLSPLALAKCRLIVRDLYPTSGFEPWCGTLIAEHEKRGNQDFAAAWYFSLVYGGANAELRVGAVFPGNCCGPLDVKHFPLVIEPSANIRWHVAEMWTGYRKGYRDLGLCRYTMLPANPRDWGPHPGMFSRTDRKHRAVIERAYRERVLQ